MKAVSEALDLFFDEFAKRTKEAPGWILLYAGIVSALLFWIPSKVEGLSLTERSTIAALLAIALLSQGDALDTAVFPREADPKQWHKIMAAAILAIAAFGALWVITEPPLEWVLQVLGVFIVWLLFVLLLAQLPRMLPKANDGTTGWSCLETKDLRDARTCASRSMNGITRGIYSVSLGLAKREKKYEWVSGTWWQNEIGKLFRSLVPLLFALTWILREHRFASALAAVSAAIAFCLYWRLKIGHMCRLYSKARRLTTNLRLYTPDPYEVTEGQWLFFWDKKVVGQREVPIPRTMPPTPQPHQSQA